MVAVQTKLCIYHIPFTHSSTDGHVGGFHLLAAGKPAALMMNMSICLPDLAWILWHIYPKVELLVYMVINWLTLWPWEFNIAHSNHILLFSSHWSFILFVPSSSVVCKIITKLLNFYLSRMLFYLCVRAFFSMRLYALWVDSALGG